MKLFCDTSFFIAYYNTCDQYHTQAVDILKSVIISNPILVTTDYIYDETLTFLLKTHPVYGYKRAYRFDVDINLERKISLIFLTVIIFSKARKIFFRYNKDKKWSFTDCASFAVMEDFGIKEALTFDHNFEEIGFKIIPDRLTIE